jgi:hypothetical protein
MEVTNVANKRLDYSNYTNEQLTVARILANPDVRILVTYNRAEQCIHGYCPTMNSNIIRL